MAAGPAVILTDAIIPLNFAKYLRLKTEQKSLLISSGALALDARIDALLAGGGQTFKVPSWKPLDDDDDNVSNDTPADIQTLSATAGSPALPSAFGDATPAKIGSVVEIGVALRRNKPWAAMDIVASVAGDDPIGAILEDMSRWWAHKLQKAFIATWSGVAKDNGANDSGDYANDIASTTYVAGVTDFSAEALIDTNVTMGDSMGMLSILMVHSVVYARMQKNNLIDFIPDARGEVGFGTFLGHRLIVDDGMPTGTAVVRSDGTAGNSGCYESWLFKPGATRFGASIPKVPVEFHREPLAGNGGGEEIITTRKEWCIHPAGHAYTGTAPDGGPTNAAATNMLNIATSWNRVYPERKQVGFARLITRES